ncbi:hypothetical protein SH601_12340 [Gracilibacillus sp. S3-1-1]|uniref:Uncharacterized protein n=1 Tax=Gracilibacillus pellucidus TaxID=3095368 RepID=A0ACC6M7F6_9BACI|nr:hypothetical protein [Gracilibacillus sp. S3-1-1]MDX8046772.1 hypothetical protein [Gracilibacillus sp. S3-1-1]
MFPVEFKKLIQPILLLVALLITIVFSIQDLSFIDKHWPNGRMVPIYDYASDWQNRFGQTLEEEEIAEIEAEYFNLLDQADKMISENAIAKQLQIANYEEFESWHEENVSGGRINEMSDEEEEIIEQGDAIEQDLIDDSGDSIVDQIYVLQNLYHSIKQFESPDTFFNNEGFTEKERVRLSETLFLKDSEGWRNILPTELSTIFTDHFEKIHRLLIILLSLLIPSVFVRDRLVGLQNIQWSSRRGRNILWTQFASGMIASFLVITCVVVFFGGFLYFTDFKQYFSNGLNSFFIEEPLQVSFYQWTFGQWIVRVGLLTSLIGMAYSGILFFLSQTSKHYLSLLMKVIPVGFVFMFIAGRLLINAFYLNNALYQWTKIPMIELYAGILLLVISISLPIIFCIRQQDKDLLD